MSSIPTKKIDGDVAVGRDVSIGGKATVRGSATVGHNLRVEGWLDAPNLKGPCKGYFTSEEELRSAYPEPQPGWWALVGTELPAPVYGERDGAWHATGATGGTVDVDPSPQIEAMREEMTDYTDGKVGEHHEEADVAGWAHLRTDSVGRICDGIRDRGGHKFFGDVEIEGGVAAESVAAESVACAKVEARRVESATVGADNIEAGSVKADNVEAGSVKADMAEVGGASVSGREVPGWVHVLTDSSERVLEGVRADGSRMFAGDVEVAGRVRAESLTAAGMDVSETETGGAGPGMTEIVTDAAGRVLRYTDDEGLHMPGFVPGPGRGERAAMRALMAVTDPRLQQSASARRVILSERGAWRRQGAEWAAMAGAAPLLTIHDDDTIDWRIASSRPSAWMNGGGYMTTLYPLLASLGLRGCVSAEGWRIGLTDEPAALNENGAVVKRLQDAAGWEVMCHSMTARYGASNYSVPSLGSVLAERLKLSSVYNGEDSNSTTSIVCEDTGLQYSINASRTGWELTAEPWIKPYVLDYGTGRTLRYNKRYPIDYQFGKFFRTAARLGLRCTCWATPGPTSTHANVPDICAVSPYGFESNNREFVNVPPLLTLVSRAMLEGQMLSGYKGEQDTDNTRKADEYEFYKGLIDDAAARKGWLVFGLHAYRPCWRNSLAGALVSEGGTYPDAWVLPTFKPGTLEPSEAMGIKDWSEWHPCPGTRLAMLRDLLVYAKSKGLENVTSSEGFERMGNLVGTGYYMRGYQINGDAEDMEGAAPDYPHYVIGRNGSEDYYCT